MLAAQARDIGRRVEDKADEFTLQIRWQRVITIAPHSPRQHPRATTYSRLQRPVTNSRANLKMTLCSHLIHQE
ncbi:hypothetical protein ACRRTK_020299 [Alexandromys fortis]